MKSGIITTKNNRTIILDKVVGFDLHNEVVRLILLEKGRYVDLYFIGFEEAKEFYYTLSGRKPLPFKNIPTHLIYDFEGDKKE